MNDQTYVCGIRLTLTTAESGGRQTALAGGSEPADRYRYRPNWGLPNMEPPDQAGGPVLAFSSRDVEPGQVVRGVIVPLFPDMLEEWAGVRAGMTLPMYEGSRVCGLGEVLWVRATGLPLSPADEARFCDWVQGPDDGPNP